MATPMRVDWQRVGKLTAEWQRVGKVDWQRAGKVDWQRVGKMATVPSAAIVGAGALGGALYTAASVMLTHAALTSRRTPLATTPASIGIDYEDVTFTSGLDGIPLKGWFVPGGDRIVLLLHGYGSNRSGPDGQAIGVLRDYVDAGISVLAYDLRGQGESGGTHIGTGWLDRADVQSAVEWAIGRGFRPGGIGIHGWSYGAACAILGAAACPAIAAVFADSPFANFADLIDIDIQMVAGRKLPPIFGRGVAFWTRHLYGLDTAAIAPERAIAEIAPRPIRILHGADDAVIPVSHAHRLLAAANNPNADLWVVPGCGHCEAYAIIKTEAIGYALSFFDRHLVHP